MRSNRSRPREVTWLEIGITSLIAILLALVFAFVMTPSARGEPERPLADVLYQVLKRTPVAPPPSDRTESPEELDARLRSIANDAASVGKGDSAAALLLGVAEHEGAFALDVDRGPCRAGTCDSGNAACLLQIHGGTPERNAQLFADRSDCFRTGLKALQASRSRCGLGPGQFASYASGSCISNGGQKGSMELVAAWEKWKKKIAAERARKG